MSSLAEFPRGIPIPVDEIRSALESVAVPGYTGVVQLEISLTAAAAECVEIGVTRRKSERVEAEPATTKQTLPDVTRKKPVQRAIERMRGRLIIRPVLTAVEAHFLDGVLQKLTLQE